MANFRELNRIDGRKKYEIEELTVIYSTHKSGGESMVVIAQVRSCRDFINVVLRSEPTIAFFCVRCIVVNGSKKLGDDDLTRIRSDFSVAIFGLMTEYCQSVRSYWWRR